MQKTMETVANSIVVIAIRWIARATVVIISQQICMQTTVLIRWSALLLSHIFLVDTRGNSMKLFCMSHSMCLLLTGNGLLFSGCSMKPPISAKKACCIDQSSPRSLNAATDLYAFSYCPAAKPKTNSGPTIAMTIQRRRRPNTVKRESDEAGTFRHSTVQEHRNMVIRQLQMISRVPRVFGWPTQPIMNLSVPLLGSGDELFEGPSVKPRVAERLKRR